MRKQAAGRRRRAVQEERPYQKALHPAGPGTLRDAIDQANAMVGVADEIVFDEAVFSTPQAILIESELPTVTDQLVITGPGSELLTLDGQNGPDREARTRDGAPLLTVDDGDDRLLFSSPSRINPADQGVETAEPALARPSSDEETTVEALMAAFGEL